MSIDKISGINFEKISFAKNDKESQSLGNKYNLTTASNQDLYNIAVIENQKKHKNDFAKYMGSFLCADVISKSILKKEVFLKEENGALFFKEASISDKLLEGAKAANGFVNFFAAIFLTEGLEKILLGKNEKFQKFKKENPMITFFGEVAGFFACAKGIDIAENKIMSIEALQPKIDSIKKYFKNIGEKIDKSSISKFIMKSGKKISDVVNKIPFIGKTCRFLLANAPWIVFICMINNEFGKQNDLKETYQDLKILRQRQIRSQNM